MPDSDPSHTASTDPRKEELASLFRQWDRGGERQAGESRGIWLRLGVTIALSAAAVFVMSLTAPSFAFWREPSEPRDLGDLRRAYVDPRSATPLVAGHVAVAGLVPTRLVPVAEEPDPDAPVTGYLFFSPLGHIVVLTKQSVAIDPAGAAAANPRLERLVQERLALPEETAVSVSAEGRLLPADEAPPELQPFVQSFAQRLQQAPSDLWVLIDGARPADVTWAAFVWALAAAAPILSLSFLLRALYRRRKARS